MMHKINERKIWRCILQKEMWKSKGKEEVMIMMMVMMDIDGFDADQADDFYKDGREC